MDRACTMEVQQIAVELVETEEWSWIEISVVLGWLSWLIICCAFLRNLGIYVWALFPLRKPKSREMAGTREETRFTDASNSLMHASKFFNSGGHGEGEQSNHTRADSSLLILQEEGTERD